MDMKGILEAFDSASSKSIEGANDMKQFLSIVSESAPSCGFNESYNQFSINKANPQDPLLNEYVPPNEYKSKFSMGEYFKLAEEEITNLDNNRRQQISECAKHIAEKVQDKVDSLLLDVLLMIRLLEFAKEDAKDDMDLHRISENLIRISKKNRLLTMQHYNAIIGKK